MCIAVSWRRGTSCAKHNSANTYHRAVALKVCWIKSASHNTPRPRCTRRQTPHIYRLCVFAPGRFGGQLERKTKPSETFSETQLVRIEILSNDANADCFWHQAYNAWTHNPKIMKTQSSFTFPHVVETHSLLNVSAAFFHLVEVNDCHVPKMVVNSRIVLHCIALYVMPSQ